MKVITNTEFTDNFETLAKNYKFAGKFFTEKKELKVVLYKSKNNKFGKKGYLEQPLTYMNSIKLDNGVYTWDFNNRVRYN